MRAPTWALVPLKASHHAKSRLAEVLDPRRRVQLFFALAGRVIRALRESDRIDAVGVVTSSREIASFARTLGAVPILQTIDVGMAPALELALHRLQAEHPARVLMLPGDLPLISEAAIEELFGAADASPNVVLAPDCHRDGTNALLCTPPLVISPHFGQRSFERHVAAAQAVSVAARVVEIDALALDLDCADDLEYLRLHGGDGSMDLLDERTVAAGG